MDDFSFRLERILYEELKVRYTNVFGHLDLKEAQNFFISYLLEGTFPAWFNTKQATIHLNQPVEDYEGRN